jgi:hypothetical protein
LQNVEISGWGAYKACGPKAEWVSVERANLHSRVFIVSVYPSVEIPDLGLPSGGPVDGLALSPVTSVGRFAIYSWRDGCGIAVGPSVAGEFIVYSEEPVVARFTPHMVNAGW